MPDERCKGCEEPLTKGDTVSYCNSGPCECEGPFCGECFDDHKSAHRMAEPVPDPLTPAEIAAIGERCPRCGAGRLSQSDYFACMSKLTWSESRREAVVEHSDGCSIRELERTLASRDAEIERLNQELADSRAETSTVREQMDVMVQPEVVERLKGLVDGERERCAGVCRSLAGKADRKKRFEQAYSNAAKAEAFREAATEIEKGTR